jgi:hypothetical protein
MSLKKKIDVDTLETSPKVLKTDTLDNPIENFAKWCEEKSIFIDYSKVRLLGKY